MGHLSEINPSLHIEVKLAASIDDKDVRHLHWLAQHHGPRVQDLIVLTTGPHAYRRPDGIAVVPLPSDSSAPEAGIFPVAGELDVERGATATGSARLRMFGEALLVGVGIGTSGSTGSTAAKTAQAPVPAAPAAAFSDGVHLIGSDIQQVK